MNLNYMQLVDHLEIGVFVVDDSGRVLFWNHWLEVHGDFAKANIEGQSLTERCPEIVGTRLEMAIHSALRQRLASLLSPGLNKPVLRLYQRLNDRATDQRMRQMIHVLPLPTSADEPRRALIQIMDVTASARREEQLRLQSSELRDRPFRDALTGLPNRRRFDEMLSESFQRCADSGYAISVIMIDIDKLKDINQRHGTQGGDNCIKRVAFAMSALLKRATDFSLDSEGTAESQPQAYRYSGEAFAIILLGTTPDKACALAENLRARIAEPERESGSKPDGGISVTVSIGVVHMHPKPGTDVDSLMSGADMALYQAQTDGRNRVSLFDLDEGVLTTLV